MRNGTLLEALIEKYEDIQVSADDWVERNLAQEVIEDLKDLRHGEG